MKVDVSICLPQEAETVGLIRGVVTDALRALGVDAECIDDIRLALSEACTNVLDHVEGDDEYEVRLEVDGATCRLSVTNTGDGFDASRLPNRFPEHTASRGRGVAIMRAVMDHVELRSEPETGTVVRLVKELAVDPGGPLDRLLQH
jgi:serine/threonine-protein kinase RsbW